MKWLIEIVVGKILFNFTLTVWLH